MTEMQIDELRKKIPGVYVTRKCDHCFIPIMKGIVFRFSGDDDHDFCSAEHRDDWQQEQKEREKSKKKGNKDMPKTKSKKSRDEDDEEDEELDESSEDEDEDEEDSSDENGEDEDEDEDENGASSKKKKHKKGKVEVSKKKKKSKSKDEDEDEDSEDEDEDEPKKKKKRHAPSVIAVVEYDSKMSIGKMWDRLKQNKGGIKKKVLYKGLGDDAHRLLAWIKIHGNRSGAWKIAGEDGTVKLIMKKKAK